MCSSVAVVSPGFTCMVTRFSESTTLLHAVVERSDAPLIEKSVKSVTQDHSNQVIRDKNAGEYLVGLQRLFALL